MIGIIDYGVGNIKAFCNVYERLGLPHLLVKEAHDLAKVDRIILPGVGAFDYAMEKLNASGIRGALEEHVLQNNLPVLGVCVGMQMLAESSEEGILPGLGWIKGKVKKFTDSSELLAIPHMGWNEVSLVKNNPLFKDLPRVARFYFLHSFYFQCYEAESEIGKTNYGIEFTAILQQNKIYGIQCHPEKSHQAGLILLRNFGEI